MRDNEAMQDSGVEWIGEIPKEWRKDKVFRLAEFISSGGTPPSSHDDYYGGEIMWVQTGDLDNDFIYESSKRLTPEGLKNSSAKIFPKDTLLIAMYGATIGKLGILAIKAATNQACCAIFFSQKIYTKFSFYMFMAMKDYLVFQSYGGGQPNISQEIIKQQYIYYPLIKSQQAISEYLDQRCAKLDAIIAIKQKQIKILDALRQSIIYQAVTKGLDANAPLVDSGVEWLGQAPKHWAIKRIKDIAELKSGNGIKAEDISVSGNYPVFGGNGLRGYTSSFTHDGHHVLIGRQGALCGNINYARGKFWATEHAVVVTLYRPFNSFWLGELLRVMNLNQYSNAAAQPGLTVDKIQFLKLPVPPIEEQKEIGEHLDKEINRINCLRDNLRQQITTLEAYKKSLIYECVTGKMRIYANDAKVEALLAS